MDESSEQLPDHCWLRSRTSVAGLGVLEGGVIISSARLLGQNASVLVSMRMRVGMVWREERKKERTGLVTRIIFSSPQK